LKAPAHVFGIEALFRVYPDARIVQTHRDPGSVIGSVASHCMYLRQAFSDEVDLHELGGTWCRLWAMGLERTLRFRREHPELKRRFLHIAYDELVANPLVSMRKIHRHFGLPLAPDALVKAQAYLSAHPKGRHGTHRYRLEDFGLDRGKVARQFGPGGGAPAVQLGDVPSPPGVL
jgi:hypothetical protein